MANPRPEPGRDRPMTLEEYLAFEETTTVKHELVDGEVHAMCGVTRRHNRIAGNIFLRVRPPADADGCRAHISDVKLRVGRSVYYPDLMVACGPELADERLEDAPCLVVEVLSPSTEATDRREKLMAYRTIASLDAYLIVAQDRRHVEHHWRDASGGWRHRAVEGDASIALPCPAITLTLDEIYDGIKLPSLEEWRRVREEMELYG